MSKEEAKRSIQEELQSTIEAQGRIITMQGEALERAIAQMKAMADGKPTDVPRNLTQDEQFSEQMKAFNRPAGPVNKVIEGCKSPDTNATFDCVMNARGVVIQLANYKLPEAATKHVRDGGLVPDGMYIQAPQGMQTLDGLSKEYRQWRGAAFYPQDNVRFVGKPFAEYLRPAAPAPVVDVVPNDMATAKVG